MYAIFSWCEAYPKSKFKYAWDISDFISDGKRLPKPDDINDDLFELIELSWKQKPEERIEIDEIINLLKYYIQ